MQRSHVAYVLILAGTILWCGGIVLAPACSSGLIPDARSVGSALYQLYHPICHQNPDRSFLLAGHHFGVCMRCTSIYGAFLIGTLLYPFMRRIGVSPQPSRQWLILAAVPMLIDATWIGSVFYDATMLTRAASGGIFGLVLPFFLLPVALEAIDEVARQHTVVRPPLQKGFSDAT